MRIRQPSAPPGRTASDSIVRFATRGVAALMLVWTAACDVEWGGAQMTLEDPAPPPDTTAVERAPDPTIIPIPPGPLLFLARLAPDGSSRVVPVARLGGEPLGSELGSIVYPDSVDPGYRDRFDSTFLASGRELELHAGGRRIGTVSLDGSSTAGPRSCPSVGVGQALLLPGLDPPPLAFAFASPGPKSRPGRPARPEQNRSMTVASPVLAERLIDDERAFLARRVALQAVTVPDDSLAGMAVTYLVADSLGTMPPSGSAISLFFLARFEPAQGFRPMWTEVRRYESAEEKAAFEYLDWFTLPAGRWDVVRRFSGTGISLAGSLLATGGDRDERELSWSEPAGCSALEALSGGR